MQELPAAPTDSNLFIRTRRLDLRFIQEADAPALFPVLDDPTLYKYTGETPPESEAALRNLFASRTRRVSPDGEELWLNWTVRERKSGDPIGYMQATVAVSYADVAWVIGSRWQKKGYGSEAARAVVEWLRSFGVTVVRAKIHPEHVASGGVAAHAGMHRTDEIVEGEEVWVL